MANDKECCSHSGEEGIGTHCVSVYIKGQSLEPRQALVDVDADGDVKYVIQIGENEGNLLSCFTCVPRESTLKNENRLFLEKTSLFTPEELSASLKTTFVRLSQHLDSLVPCVGCRTAAETMLRQVGQGSWPQLLSPLVVREEGREISLGQEYSSNSLLLYTLFCAQGPLYDHLFNELTKFRRNRRCALHSLESQRVTLAFDWLYTWDQLSIECRINITQIPLGEFKTAFHSHLHKHRFCPECRVKMERAYCLLVQDQNSEALCDDVLNREFRPEVYYGLRICREEAEPHVHIDSQDEDFIADLMERAYEDLNCSRQERHAKTLEVAQEEVVKCLATFLLEKIHRIGQKIRSEAQTWILLMSQSIDIFKSGFETALEGKQGFSRLDAFLWEHQKEEENKLFRKVHKKEKRSKKKRNKKVDEESTCNSPALKPQESEDLSITNDQKPSELTSDSTNPTPSVEELFQWTCSKCGVKMDSSSTHSDHCGKMGPYQFSKQESIPSNLNGTQCNCNSDGTLISLLLCKKCQTANETVSSSLFDGVNTSDTEDDFISPELLQLQSSLPQLKKERERYREQLRKKWSTLSTTNGSV